MYAYCTVEIWCKGNNCVKQPEPENRKLSDAGHVMRNTSGHYDDLLTTIVGLEGKRGRGIPARTWVGDLTYWTGSKRYD